MKYAIMASYYMWNGELETEYEQWLYLGVEGEKKLFVFDDDVNSRTKLFDSATEAGKYVDKHFNPNEIRMSFSRVRIVEIKEEEKHEDNES